MSSLRRASTILARIEDGLAGFVLAAVLCVVVYELTIRGVFGHSNLWTDEISRVLLIVMTYIGAIGLTRDGANVRVELFVDRMNAAQRDILERLIDVLCLAFAVTATVLGYRYVQESALFGISFAHSDLPFPIWVAQSIIPIGFAVMSLRLVLRLIGIRPVKPAPSVEA
ncbi:MAG: TRAP transporter small permease subunit [Pseudolabrys sp.]|nr:TRAP transporter small permease subunit [Pseudolabrys sp.]